MAVSKKVNKKVNKKTAKKAAPKKKKAIIRRPTAGQPPKYESVEELQAKIDEYFDDPPIRKAYVKGEVMNIPVITITGLALHLGFESRQSFYDYEKVDKFSYTIKKARTKIENEYEVLLQTSGAAAGPIFGLKNLGWSDKQEHEVTGAGGGPIKISVNFVEK